MPAYRVALCEDETAAREQIDELSRSIFAAKSLEVEITAFASADELFRELNEMRTAYDLYLLDIEMQEGSSGLDLARQLYSWGVRNRIVFITGNPEYAINSYDVEPLHYLLKPVSREKMEVAINRALAKRGAQTVMFQRAGKDVPVKVQDMLYLESWNHGIVIHLREGKQTFSMPLTEAERLLPSGSFQRCHKSFLVNLAWVERASHSGVLLKDGRQLPMGRTFYAGFQNALVHRLNS